MSILRRPFLFLSQNVSAPISGALISALYISLCKGGRITKPEQPSRKANHNYNNKLVEYNCAGEHVGTCDKLDGHEKARDDLTAILRNSNDQTFIFVKNAHLLDGWDGVPRRMRGQVYFDNYRPGALFGFFVISLCIAALVYSAAPTFQKSGLTQAILSVASSVLIFIIPIVALKGVEDRIVEATEHQTELDFTSHAARIEEALDRLEGIMEEQAIRSAAALIDASADQKKLHEETSNFVEKMQRRIADAYSDLHQVSLLAPNEQCSLRASRIHGRIGQIKDYLESM